MDKIWHTGYSHSNRWRKKGLYRLGRQLSISSRAGPFWKIKLLAPA